MKAILVVDIGNDEYLLNKKIDSICFRDGDKIYDNFNFLKPMPQKEGVKSIEFIPKGMWGEYENRCFGWNACLDEILGDTE